MLIVSVGGYPGKGMAAADTLIRGIRRAPTACGMASNRAWPSGFGEAGCIAVLACERAAPAMATGKLFRTCAQASTGFATGHANGNRLANRPLAHATSAGRLRTERIPR